MIKTSSFNLRPGQVRPIAFRIEASGSFTPDIELRLFYTLESSLGTEEISSSLTLNGRLEQRSIYEPHKVTFMHPGGVVSYAILRPPSREAQKICSKDSAMPLPVLLQLHGAGLEADDEAVAHSLDPVPDLCAWALFPTGVTPWSGDDWHTWGFVDVQAAIGAIPGWIQRTGWKGPQVDIEKWFVSGHSNGGQGAWYTATHRPDNVIALAPVSGYLSIQSYVPYDTWRMTDPRRQGVIQASLNNYRHELLADNLKGIPILQQHGSADDNVPVWHSRAMHQLIEQASWHSFYSEIPGSGHWFDGVMTTEPLSDFYKAKLSTPDSNTKSNQSAQLSGFVEFSIVVTNPAATDSKNGIKILHLILPDQVGTINVKFQGSQCILSTSNILGFQIQNERCSGGLVVDGQEQQRDDGQLTKLFYDESNLWRVSRSIFKVRRNQDDLLP